MRACERFEHPGCFESRRAARESAMASNDCAMRPISPIYLRPLRPDKSPAAIRLAARASLSEADAQHMLRCCSRPRQIPARRLIRRPARRRMKPLARAAENLRRLHLQNHRHAAGAAHMRQRVVPAYTLFSHDFAIEVCPRRKSPFKVGRGFAHRPFCRHRIPRGYHAVRGPEPSERRNRERALG